MEMRQGIFVRGECQTVDLVSTPWRWIHPLGVTVPGESCIQL